MDDIIIELDQYTVVGNPGKWVKLCDTIRYRGLKPGPFRVNPYGAWSDLC